MGNFKEKSQAPEGPRAAGKMVGRQGLEPRTY